MFTPFLVCDSRSGVALRLTGDRLAELSLAPRQELWAPGRVAAAEPDPVWADSLAAAPAETLASISAALEALVLATPDLRPPSHDGLPEGRAGRHLQALVGLWQRLGDALPPGLAAVHHALTLPAEAFLDPLPVVDGSLDPHAPRAMRALHDHLKACFGTVPARPRPALARAGSRLRALQNGLTGPVEAGPPDDSLRVFGLRDPAQSADFAAARARALIDAGVRTRDIAVLTADDGRHLARAFAAQGVPLSGLPASPPARDLVGEAALHLLLSKRPPTPAMVLASLALSPLMPWPAATGRALAEELMGGDFRAHALADDADHAALWDDIRATASSLAQFRFLCDRICGHLTDGAAVFERLPLPPGEGSPDWEAILRAVQIAAPAVVAPDRNLEGVSLWAAEETPWRPCRHLIVTDFSEGLYPVRPSVSPFFLDSEIAAIRAATGLELPGRASAIARSLARLDEQLQAASESVTLLVPYRDLAGQRLAPSTGLSLIARALEGADATPSITDLSRLPASDWPIASHAVPPVPPAPPCPPIVSLGGDLLALRREEDGRARPQSPSRLETLMVSPLAWLLDQIGASDLAWSPEALDVMIRGNVVHAVLEALFPANAPMCADDALDAAVAEACEAAIRRTAGFLRGPAWEMERVALQREIGQAVRLWREHLSAMGAAVVGTEIWLRGEAHGIRMHGKADAILRLRDGTLLIVDHKTSGTRGRKDRMTAGWDLQAGLYRDMLLRPERSEGDGMDLLLGAPVGFGYHLTRDGGLLTSGLAAAPGGPARDMGDAVNMHAIARLVERLAQVGAGRLVLNTDADEKFFRSQAKMTPYALTDGSALVRAFLRAADEQEG